MAEQHPTIIVGHLKDDELKQSITNLVNHVKKGLEEMVASTNTAVDTIQQKLKSIGDTKVEFPKSRGDKTQSGGRTSSPNATAEIEREIKARKELKITLDQEILGRQKVSGKNVVIQQYDEQIEKLKKRLVEVRKDIDIFNYAIGSGKKTQVEWGQTGLKQANAEAERLMRTIAAMEHQRGNLARVTEPQGHQIQNYVNSLKTANPELQRLNEQYRRCQSLLQNQSAAEQQAAEGTKKYTAEIIAQANAIRESERWKRGETVWMTNEGNVKLSQTIPLEQQLVDLQYMGRRIVFETAEAQEKVAENVNKTKQAYSEAASAAKRVKENASIPTFTIPLESSRKLNERLKELREQYSKLNYGQRRSDFGKSIAEQIRAITRQTQILNQELNRPTRKEIAGLSETTLDNIAYKISQLQAYKRGINITDPKQTQEIKDVDREINRLQKDLNSYMSTTRQASQINNALTRSWNYMKNRLAFYFTVGASTQFVRNLIEIRSQYEMNERALGILIGSAERGTQIFNELSQMSLVSPYTLIELSAAAKQLTAYDVEARNVVDTTRRLADMAAAVGIPIERLTYALGQVKAFGYLNSRDARMFSNAGIPLVKQLSEYYTELEGRMVSTADIYDRIKKKAIGYNEVMQVMYKMTDEGGKFYDFQAKMADTLKVRLANFTLAWNNMLNDIGKSNQGFIVSGINGLTKLLRHWKDLNSLLIEVAVTYGVVKAASFAAVNMGLAQKFTFLATSAKQLGSIANIFTSINKGFTSLVSSPLTWISLAAFAFVDLGAAIVAAENRIREFNKSMRDSATENLKNINDYLGSQSTVGVRNQLWQQNGRNRTPTDIDESEATKAWEMMREQIELSVSSSDQYIGRLLDIENVSERLRQGFALLDNIQQVDAAIKEIGEDTFKFAQDYSKWWNLWTFEDGLIGNLDDYNNRLKDVVKTYGSISSAKQLANNLDINAEAYLRALDGEYKQLKDDADGLAKSINDFIDSKGFGDNPEQITEVYSQVLKKIEQEYGLSAENMYTLQTVIEQKRSEIIRNAIQNRIADEESILANSEDEKTKITLKASIERNKQLLQYYSESNDEQRVEWERYTKFVKDNFLGEMQDMFGSLSDEQLRNLNWQEDKYQKFIERTAKSYAQRHKMSYEDAFSRLKSLINNANAWQIFIRLHIVATEEKSVVDELKEADENLETALKNVDRLKKREEDLQGRIKKDSKNRKENAELLLKTTKERVEEEKKAEEAREKGGISKTEEKAAAKAAKDAEKERKKQQRDALKQQREAESELQRTLKNELTLIDKIRSVYKELTKDGMSHAHAIQVATKGYEKTEQSINAVLSKWGLGQFRARDYAGITNPNELLRKLKAQLERINATGRAKPAEIKDFEVKIKELVVDAEKYNLTKITKGLNTELDKLKDEYELAVEIDANPELGNAFADMFGINVDDMPHTFAEMFDRANKIIKEEMRKLGVDMLDLYDFDILRTSLKPTNGMWNGFDSDGSVMQALTKWQNTFRDMYKKNMTETENMLDEYVKKYGDFSDKIAEIESDRLDKIRKLNEAYFTEEMRKRPDYLSKLNAIEQGARREKDSAAFDEFKNSRLYVEMFENLEYVSTATLEAMREKLENLKSELGSLSPEQLKSVIQQFEKIDNELISRNPFKGLIRGAKDYAKAVGKQGKKAQEDFRVAQRKYDFELGTLATMKEQLEQVKAEHPMQEERIKQLEEEVAEQEGIVAKRREELEIAAELNEQYNLMRRLFGEQAQAIAKVISTIASNLQSLSELRDTIQQTFGVDLGSNLNATIDGLSKVGNGLSQIVSSAQSANVVGVVTGAVNTVYGIGDSIASIFGKGSAKTKKLNKQIEKSAKTVQDLNNAYKALERSVDKSLGKAETEARRLAIANKEAELAELQRQLTLEKRKRKKDEDSDAIADYESRIQDLKYEIEDLNDTLVSELLGSDIKSAAEGFVDAWVGAWREGETTLDAIEQKMDEMIMNLIKKAATSAIVSKILKPLYDAVDQYTSEASEGGVEMTQNEIAALAALSKQLGVDIDVALGAYYKNLERIGAVSQTVDESKSLSALQAGIQGITEETAGALEAYMNSVSQQVYLHSDLLTQIRDAVVAFDLDVSTATISQILLQLQSSYQVQMSINNILNGVLTPNGRSFSVELAS